MEIIKYIYIHAILYKFAWIHNNVCSHIIFGVLKTFILLRKKYHKKITNLEDFNIITLY